VTAIEYAQQVADELYPDRKLKVVGVKYDDARGAIVEFETGHPATLTGLWAFEIKKLLREHHGQ
jgi:hypothetical protein